jgi:hypothetical protein
MRFIRFVLVLGLLAAVKMASAAPPASTFATTSPAPASTPTAAPETQAAQAAFNAAFAADLARVKASRDPKESLELAGRMLATAKETQTQVAFLTLLCEKAYDLAVPYPSGLPTALEAMTLLASLAPEKATACADAVAEVRQRQFLAARDADRGKAGENLIDALVKAAGLREQAGTIPEAITLYKKAQAVAAAVRSDRKAALDAKVADLMQAAKMTVELAALKKQVQSNPADADARERLVRLYLVCLDDPATAATYLDGVKDASLCKYLPAVLRGPDAAPELACLEIGDWYCGLAETAPAAAKAAMLARARGYYVRFLELHMTDDLDRIKAAAALKKVEAGLGGAAGPAAATPKAPAAQSGWIDLLKAVDLKKDVVRGEWQREANAVTCMAKESGGPPPCLMLPVLPRGDYELEVGFARTAGSGYVHMILPVESRAVTLSLSSGNLKDCSLEFVDGNKIKGKEPAAKSDRIETNRQYAVLCKVCIDRDKAQINVTLDGNPLITWKGPLSALSVVKDKRLPNPACPGLAMWRNTVVFNSARLRMLSGEAKPLR